MAMNPPPPGGHNGAKEAAAERRVLAFELRKGGATVRAIAKTLTERGYPIKHAQVAKDINRVLDELNSQSLGLAERYRRMQLERLNDMLLGLWPAAKKGSPVAVLRVLNIMEREAKLLGLDAPTRIDLTARIRAMAESEGLDPDEAVRTAQAIVKGVDFDEG